MGDRFQFERNGFFVVDKHSSLECPIFNFTIGLKESRPSPSHPGRSRKMEQERLAAEKEARKKQDPHHMFLEETDKYSKFDGNGVPTHDVNGEPLSKKGVKKLQKEWDNQKKLFESANE